MPLPEAKSTTPASSPVQRSRSDWLFWSTMSMFGLLYLALIISMVVADFGFTSWNDIRESLNDPRVQFSIWLSLITCSMSAIMSVWIAIPTGFVLSRLDSDLINHQLVHRPVLRRVAGCFRQVAETVFDIPIVMPPLVVGISLLVLFQTPVGRWMDHATRDFIAAIGYPGIRGITYEIPAVILGQFTVAAAFAVRTMKNTFDQIEPRPEQVALTLGAGRYQAFSQVTLPQAWRGVVAAFTLAWARSLGEFGPILIFAGTAQMKTEVLSTTVYLNFQFGNLRGAVAASIILLTLAVVALIVTRLITTRTFFVGVDR